MPWLQGDNVQWPIPVRRNGHSGNSSPTSEHERSIVRGETEGEMDPELLLNYGLERINLPSGKMIFKCVPCADDTLHNSRRLDSPLLFVRWLAKQEAIQNITVYMFWFIKCKMFQEDASDAQEYLLDRLSQQYVRVMEILGRKTREQHEKDFIFYYLPFIIGNAVYFGEVTRLGAFHES